MSDRQKQLAKVALYTLFVIAGLLTIFFALTRLDAQGGSAYQTNQQYK